MSYILLFQIILLGVITILFFQTRRNLELFTIQNQGLSKNETGNNNITNKRTIENFYIGKDRRQYFRVQLYDIDCLLEFINFEDKKLFNLVHKKIEGNIENISLGGIKFTCDINLPLRNTISVNVKFKLKDKEFSIDGNIIRKEEYSKSNTFSYGIQFNELPSDVENELLKTLNQILIDRDKKVIS